MARIVRARRYVSAPAGSYPKPVRAGAVAVATVTEEEFLADTEVPEAPLEFEASVAPAKGLAGDPGEPASTDELAAAPALGGGVTEPEALVTAPDTLAALDAPKAAGESAVSAEPTAPGSAAPDSTAEDEATQARPRRSLAGILVGTLGGAVFGMMASLVLLASSREGSLLTNLTDPVGLWNSIEDPLVQVIAIVITAGFVMLGLGLGCFARPRAPRGS